MRSNSNGCLATSGENAEVQRGLHKLTENPVKGMGEFLCDTGSVFTFYFLMHIQTSWILKPGANPRGIRRLHSDRKLDFKDYCGKNQGVLSASATPTPIWGWEMWLYHHKLYHIEYEKNHFICCHLWHRATISGLFFFLPFWDLNSQTSL